MQPTKTLSAPRSGSRTAVPNGASRPDCSCSRMPGVCAAWAWAVPLRCSCDHRILGSRTVAVGPTQARRRHLRRSSSSSSSSNSPRLRRRRRCPYPRPNTSSSSRRSCHRCCRPEKRLDRAKSGAQLCAGIIGSCRRRMGELFLTLGSVAGKLGLLLYIGMRNIL